MEKTFLLEIVTPEKVVFSQQVSQAILPAYSGLMTVLPDHSPMIGLLNAGKVRIEHDGKEDIYVVYPGFFEVVNNKVNLLVDSAQHLDELDHDDLAARIAAAKRALEHEGPIHERNKHEDIFMQLSSLQQSIHDQ